MERHDLLYPLDEVSLLQTAITHLVPVTQDLLEVLDLELLEVHRAEVNLLLVCQLTNLTIFLLQLLTDLITRHAPRQGLGHFSKNPGGGVRGPSQEIAEPVLFELQILAEILEGRLDLVRLGGVFLWQHCVHESLQYCYANLAIALLEKEVRGSVEIVLQDDQSLYRFIWISSVKL